MEMGLEQYHNFLERLISAGENLNDRLLIVPANNLIAAMDERITMRGEDTNGEKIGDYSKKPWFAEVDDFTNKGNFKPQQKKNGKGIRKSVTLEEGYFELRALDGQRNDTVVLERTGAAIKNIKSGLEGNTALVGFTDQDEANKIRWYEKKKNKSVLAPTRVELETVEVDQHEQWKEIIHETISSI